MSDNTNTAAAGSRSNMRDLSDLFDAEGLPLAEATDLLNQIRGEFGAFGRVEEQQEAASLRGQLSVLRTADHAFHSLGMHGIAFDADLWVNAIAASEFPAKRARGDFEKRLAANLARYVKIVNDVAITPAAMDWARSRDETQPGFFECVKSKKDDGAVKGAYQQFRNHKSKVGKVLFLSPVLSDILAVLEDDDSPLSGSRGLDTITTKVRAFVAETLGSDDKPALRGLDDVRDYIAKLGEKPDENEDEDEVSPKVAIDRAAKKFGKASAAIFKLLDEYGAVTPQHKDYFAAMTVSQLAKGLEHGFPWDKAGAHIPAPKPEQTDDDKAAADKARKARAKGKANDDNGQ